ncbi:Endonuclease/exonuclease/phosphatase [Lyophyllum atratum]|nr:Endonuclease/exonuclease/phosphatase [Lyophyllum atratum]
MASTTTPRRFQPTPEQLALSELRKAKKEKNAALSQQPENSDAGSIIERPWIPIQPSHEPQHNAQRVKVLTWNLLAQCLVRRDLFPTSNCLKAGQREHMLYRELLATQADVLCLQEVDRLEKLLPALENAGYAHNYAAGPGKMHGCLIAFKEELYTMLSAKTIHYDAEEIRSDGDEKGRRGKSFHTRNIGSLVSLQSKSAENEGVIIATTHLFWHPRYVTYERARQTGILVREAVRFRAELERDHWPCIISGDFNFAPDDPAYSLLVGDALLPDQEQRLLSSHVVHVSVDPAVLETPKAVAEEGNEEAADPDRIITNARPATQEDGLLSPAELVEFFSRIPKLRSVYDTGLGKVKDLGGLQTFSSTVTVDPPRRGSHEPAYTSYTHYWKTVLGSSSPISFSICLIMTHLVCAQDYIFVLDPVDRRSTVVALLAPHRTEDLDPGLPQKGISSSDHVSLAADICWEKTVKS